MKLDNARNTVIFIVCTVVILILYQVFVLQPQATARKAALAAESAQPLRPDASAAVGPQTTPTSGNFVTDRTQALSGAARVPISTPTLRGSLSLQGGRIDDLFLTKYRTTIKPDAGLEELFRPQGMEHAFFAQFGWISRKVPSSTSS